MKKRIFPYLGFLLAMLIALPVMAHDDQRPGAKKIEQLWVSHGPSAYVAHLKKEKQLSERKLSVFVGKARGTFEEDRKQYFNSAELQNPDLSKEMELRKRWLNDRQKVYDELYITVSKSKEFETADNNVSFGSSLPPTAPPPSSGCTTYPNIGFESGNTGNWTIEFCDINGSCSVITPPHNHANLMGPGPGSDNKIPALPTRPPLFTSSSYSLKLEDDLWGGYSTKATYQFTVNAAASFLKYWYAVVLEDPGDSHSDNFKPYFDVRVQLKSPAPGSQWFDLNCAAYHAIANANSKELRNNFVRPFPDQQIYYKPWSMVHIPLDDYINYQVIITFKVGDCGWGGHFGYAYIDLDCDNAQIVDNGCLPDGRRMITAPSGFPSYIWTGAGISGDNGSNVVYVDEPGTYTVYFAANKGGCPGDMSINVGSCPKPPAVNCSITNLSAVPSSCNANNNSYSLAVGVTFSNPPQTGILLISVGGAAYTFHAPFTSPLNITLNNLYADAKNYTLKSTFYPSLFTSALKAQCSQTASFTAPGACTFPTALPCTDCIPGFKPIEGKKYVISAWVRDPAAVAAQSFTAPRININFTGSSTTYGPFLAEGMIIDGWQRIYQEFTIPTGATDLSIELNTNGGEVFFDDIRVHPVDGSFISYVYDPVSLKLVATLDDNNYATIYEYDQEGKLIRVKKETERGIMTIQENRDNQPKR